MKREVSWGGVWRERERESGACLPLPTESTFVFIRWQSRGISTGAVGEKRTVPVLARFRKEFGDFNDFVDREKRMLTGASNFQEARVVETSGNSEQKLIPMN